MRVSVKAKESVRERAQPLRERLLQAAETAVSTRGLAGLKARELSAAAGCALGAIYTAFDDLDELVLSVNLRTLERLERALDDALRDADPAEALLSLARAYLDFARREEPSWRALFEHRLSGGAPVPDWYAEARNRLFGRLEAPLARLLPDQSPDQRARLARTLFSAVHGVVALGLEQKIADMTPETLDAQLETVVRLIAAGLAKEAARAS
jgi:AcrR family transcriptional regulator